MLGAMISDADTQACIVDGITEVYYKKEIPKVLIDKTCKIFPKEFLKIVYRYQQGQTQ